jgi:hypothetical protein
MQGASREELPPVLDAAAAVPVVDPAPPDDPEPLGAEPPDAVAAAVPVATTVADPVEIGPTVFSPAADIGPAF